MKKCSKCGEHKPLGEYYKRSDTKSGYHAQCKKCVIAKVSETYFANPEPAKQRSKVWRKDNPEKVILNNRQWRHANREYNSLRNFEWRKNNAQKHKDNSKKWAKNNPDKRRANNYLRRSNLKANGQYAINKKEIQKLYAQMCIYCGINKATTLDHVIPIKRGGTHSIGNLVPACQSCNSSKNTKTITEWKKTKRNPA